VVVMVRIGERGAHEILDVRVGESVVDVPPSRRRSRVCSASSTRSCRESGDRTQWWFVVE